MNQLWKDSGEVLKLDKKKRKEVYITDRQGILNGIGERLENLRKSLNINQSTVARDTGIALQSVRYYEKGLSEPRASTLIKLALYFGTSVDFILFGDETNETIYKWTI